MSVLSAGIVAREGPWSFACRQTTACHQLERQHDILIITPSSYLDIERPAASELILAHRQAFHFDHSAARLVRHLSGNVEFEALQTPVRQHHFEIQPEHVRHIPG